MVSVWAGLVAVSFFMLMGWIKIHRQFLDWEWFDEPYMVKLFITLLLLANHEDGNWRGVAVKRGQVITGLKSLSKQTKISIQSLRTCLSRLEKTGEITSKTTNIYRVITICNYEHYQGVESATNNQTNKQPTSNQQATNKQLTTNKNDKNDKNDNNIKESFEIFWQHYHTITQSPKTDKEPALKHWKKLTLTERREAYKQVQKYYDSIRDKKYVKKARTYLSDKNFNDELTPVGGSSVYKADNVWEEKF